MKFTGRVVFFKERPGYGFVKMDDPPQSEIFFYHKYIQMPGYKTLQIGTIVRFEMGENHKGPMATKIEILRMPDGTEPEF